MRFILEGPDNAGKTTLANSIKHILGPRVEYFHPGGKPADLDAEGMCIEEQLDMLMRNSAIIMDRCTPISQAVYNADPQLEEWREHMWQRYAALGATVIYCRPSTDKLLRVQDLTWRDGETDEHKEKIIRNQHTFVQRYDAIMQDIPNLSYDYEDKSHANIIRDKMVQALQGQTEAAKWFHNLINLRG
jgi:thymidylate kinase